MQQNPPPAHGTDVTLRGALDAQASISRLALADTDVNKLLVGVCSLLAEHLGCEHAAFLEAGDNELRVLATVATGDGPAASVEAPLPAPEDSPAGLAEHPEIHAALSRLGITTDHHGVIVTFAQPNGRRVGLVVAGSDDISTLDNSMGLVELAAELVASGWARRHLEQQLRDSERRLVEAQELAHMGSYDWNIITDENNWSDELFRIYGYEPGAFNASYERFLSMLHPDDRDKIMAVHQEAYATHKPYQMEERIVHPDGSERLLASTGEVIADEHGQPVRMRGTCIDITDRRRVEAEIRRLDQADERRRHALEINDNVVQGLTSVLWTLQRGAYDTTVEVARNTLESARSMMSRLLDITDEVHPGDLTRSAPAERLILDLVTQERSGRAGSNEPTRIVIADDSDDIRMLLGMQLASTGSVEIVGEATTGPDAVDQAAAHQPDVILLDMAMPGGDGLSAMPGILAASPHTKIIALSGFSATELAGPALGAGATAYIEKGSFDDLLDVLEREVPSFSRQPEDAPALDAFVDRTPDPVEFSEVEVALGHLVHELRTPSTVVAGIATLLADGRDTLPSAAANEMYQALVRNTSVLNELLDRVTIGIQATSGTLEQSDVDLRALIAETARDLAQSFDIGRVSIDGPPVVVAHIDAVRMRQVISNLLTNASRFAPAGTDIRISVAEADGRVEIAVEDHGPGVDPALRSRIFRPFVREPGRRGGLGLGLFLSQSIARAHGGDLRYDDTYVDGARLVLSVPSGRTVDVPG